MGSVHADDLGTFGGCVLERKLGAGGMAEVFLARRRGPHGFEKRVAIKRMLPDISEDPELVQMFCDEARVAATLSHPNIAQVIEFGEENGELFIVMEYVDGVSCAALLRAATAEGGQVPVGPALTIAHEVLQALAFAHEATDEAGRALGIVHRDISPSNVLVSRTGNVKLIDFGITRSLLAERRTQPGEMKGKLRYMSPEQLTGGDAEARSDLFAVGVVLAELLSGRVLFAGKSHLDILARISRGDVAGLRDGRIPADLVRILDTALAHDPGDRFPSAGHFARALEDAALAREVRLGDGTLAPYVHSLGLFPGSGTRPRVSSERPRRGPPPLLGTGRATLPDLPGIATAGGRSPSGTHRLRTRSGELVGPLPRAEMLALIATGRLSARSHVSLRAGVFVTTGSVPALATLANHPAYRFRDDDEASPEWLARLDAISLPTALFRLAEEGRTGVFVAVDGKRRKRVFLDAGDPVFVASTSRDELLGQRLVTSGKVPARTVELALGTQPPHALGAALVLLGAITPAELGEQLARQIEDRVVELGRWRAGEMRFFPGTHLPAGCSLRTLIPTLHLVARLVRAEYPPGDIATLLRPFTKSVLAPTSGHRTFVPFLGLTAGEAQVLSIAREARPLREVITRATGEGVSMAEALRAVFLGLCSGVLQAEGWPAVNT